MATWRHLLGTLRTAFLGPPAYRAGGPRRFDRHHRRGWFQKQQGGRKSEGWEIEEDSGDALGSNLGKTGHEALRDLFGGERRRA
jgi:hypothetical protein